MSDSPTAPPEKKNALPTALREEAVAFLRRLAADTAVKALVRNKVKFIARSAISAQTPTLDL